MMAFATYLGGEDVDDAKSVACDAQGNVYITGNTKSLNAQTNSCQASSANQFPLCNPGNNAYFQSTNHGQQDIFLVKLNHDNYLQWSTFFGSSSADSVYEINIAVDPAQNINPSSPSILICGSTERQSSGSNACAGTVPSSEFPLCNSGGQAFFQAASGAFISRFSQQGELLWSSNFNNISMFQTITSSRGYIYAAGIKKAQGTPIPGTCGPQSGNGIPICSINGGFDSNTDSPDLYIVKIKKLDNSLNWSSLYGNGSFMDFSRNYIFQQPAYPHVYPKYIDAVASEDDELFILGTTTQDFDCYNSQSNANWYNQTVNHSYDHGSPGEPTADASILYLNPTQDREWATLFGSGGGLSFLQFPMLAEFGSSTILRDNSLLIAGYAGSDGQAMHHFPFVDEGGGAYFSNGLLTNHNHYDFDGFIAKFDLGIALSSDKEAPMLQSFVSIFPNPASQSFQMLLHDGNLSCTFSISDITGKVVTPERNYTMGDQPIEVSELAKGMYLVSIRSGNNAITIKLIKQ